MRLKTGPSVMTIGRLTRVNEAEEDLHSAADREGRGQADPEPPLLPACLRIGGNPGLQIDVDQAGDDGPIDRVEHHDEHPRSEGGPHSGVLVEPEDEWQFQLRPPVFDQNDDGGQKEGRRRNRGNGNGPPMATEKSRAAEAGRERLDEIVSHVGRVSRAGRHRAGLVDLQRQAKDGESAQKDADRAQPGKVFRRIVLVRRHGEYSRREDLLQNQADDGHEESGRGPRHAADPLP